ncbi:hypothetical protein [Staphylococcus canis]|uniref:Lipoprotein n=1 Tax=Staphylococcus canis TaxID=2724942 RepID=A0ABS0T8Z6_9STAP|nr:hypothetical protein [Staphylococcus canis]MBI5975224.1 hypothetical protein [Staphylococcus canis]
MRKLLSLLLISSIVLVACGQEKINEEQQDKPKEGNTVKSNQVKIDKKEEKSTNEKNTKQDLEKEQPNAQSTNVDQYYDYNQQQKMNYEDDNKILNNKEITDQDWNQQGEPTQSDQMQYTNETNASYASSGSTYVQYDPNNKYMNLPNQEWRKNTGDGLSSGEKQTMYEIENGTYQGEDEEQIYEALKFYEQNY